MTNINPKMRKDKTREEKCLAKISLNPSIADSTRNPCKIFAAVHSLLL